MAGERVGTAYSGLTGVLSGWFRVSFEPPSLPPGHHTWHRSFGPAPQFLRYLKLQYLLLVGVVAVVLGLAGAGVMVGMVLNGAPGPLIAVVAAVLGFLALCGLVGYAALQLQYDTTWYTMTDRALRLRSGIWVQKEMTVTFDNAQNVKVRRGPIQRWLGIGDVVVETAAAGTTDGQQGTSTASAAVVAGVANPHEIRDRIIERMRAVRTSGLGDPDDGTGGAAAGMVGRPEGKREGRWTPAHLEVLREIREAVRGLG